MARSDIKTWLPLDTFAEILGIDPLAFNGLTHPSLRRNTTCGEIFFQYDWQHSDRVGRETIAMTIAQAEQQIAAEVGYNLIPDWTSEERLPYPRPSVPELYGTGLNSRLQLKSVEARRGKLISGGFKAKTLIEAGANIVRSDDDTDGFQETCTVNVATSLTDVNEIHAYYPAKDGEDGWEVRPIKVTISGGNARIVFKIWQVVAANQQERLDGNVLDATAAGTFETEIDVYRVYNDTTTQVQFLWEYDPTCSACCGSCTACTLGTQTGCMHFRDPYLGILVPSPATYDSSDGSWDLADWEACREPDQVRLWYYSGHRNPSMTRSYVDMDQYWRFPVAVFAASKFDRPVCDCSNVKEFIDKWRRDAAFQSDVQGGFTMTAELAKNRLGTTMGALYAYRAIQQNGVRINK